MIKRVILGLIACALLIGAQADARVNRTPAGRILVIMYGQSNMNHMVLDTATPPTPAANTFIYNTVTGALETPAAVAGQGAGNGVINLLNDIATANPGRTIIAVNGAQDGSTVAGLSKSDPGNPPGNLTAVYQTMMGNIKAVRRANDQVFIVWHQGEGDAEAAPHEVEKYYKDTLSQLHSDLVTDMGLTKAQVPLFIGTLGTGSAVYTPTPVTAGKQDQTYTTIRAAHQNAALEQTNVHLSHSSMDLARAADAYHWTPAGYGVAGKRFAQSINTYLGLGAGEARFSIASVALGTATTTLVNVAHVLGTDFTVGTDGWQVSGNNGATWVAATPSRVSATQISLSHASLASLSRARLVRYQYGQNPTVASPVKDNSALAIPLLPTTWDQVPTNPTTVIPVPTWRTTTQRGTATGTQNFLRVPLGPEQVQKFAIIGLVGGIDATATPPTVTLTPNVGATVTATLVQQVASSPVAIFKALIPSSLATFTDVQVVIPSGFAETTVTLWTVPAADLTSQVETGKAGLNVAAGTAVTVNTLNASAGGFAVAVARNSNNTGSAFGSVTSPVGTSSGSTTTGDSWAQRWEYVTGIELQSADASNLTASAASAVTFTFADSGSLDVAVAAWR